MWSDLSISFIHCTSLVYDNSFALSLKMVRALNDIFVKSLLNGFIGGNVDVTAESSLNH